MTILAELDTPMFAAEGIPDDADPQSWTITLAGLVGRESKISLADLGALPPASVDCRLTSVSGWSVRAEWNGVLWREFLAAYPPLPEASHAVFVSKGGYRTTVPLAELDHPRVLWCWAVGTEPLEVRYGGPIRMVIPNLWGYKSCKWIVRVEFTDAMTPGYWESRGYTLSGAIEPGMTLDVNSGQRRKIGGGEVIDF